MQMRLRTLIVIAAVVVLLVTILIVVSWRGPRVVARAVSPNGAEMFVMQEPNWFGDPWFTTRFVVRTADGVWNSYYYSHEDTYWWGPGRFVLETNASRAVVYRGTNAVIRFQWDTGIYQITRPYADGTSRPAQTREPESVSDSWMPRSSRRQ